MSVVWKYPFPMAPSSGQSIDRLDVEVPAGTRFLAFAFQRKVPTVWMLLPDEIGAKLERRHFRLIGTGHEFEADEEREVPATIASAIELVYRGTALGYDDELVLHLFEEVEPPPPLPTYVPSVARGTTSR